ncbi:MAG: SUMF1/EgtB/PvdO family nonheme iron enzyme [Planctomycetes bacterium]|nr:SUMF1/EgtB/PvdO family nonheme iron enzyme [Planctomycetota bacterium]
MHRFLPFVLALAWLGMSGDVGGTSPRAQGDPRPGASTAHDSAVTDPKVDPALLRDARYRDGSDPVGLTESRRPGLRVLIELVREPGDATFQTARGAAPELEVLGDVAARQGRFLARLQRDLTPVDRAGIRIVGALQLQYVLVAEVADLAAVRTLAGMPSVRFVWKDESYAPATGEGRALTGSATQAAQGFTGAGIGVAVLDTRFDLLHPELGASERLPNAVVKAGIDLTTGGIPHSRVLGECLHGTGIASVVRRYAPECDLYVVNVFDSATGLTSEAAVAAGLEWVVLNRSGSNGGAPIRVVNMSLGGTVPWRTPVAAGVLHEACAIASACDIVCLAAAGNSGWNDALASPGALDNTLSVGAVWDANDAAYTPFEPALCAHEPRFVDERTCYSNMAAFLSFYCPSEEQICARCGGGTFALGGTSGACAAASGLVAQFLHARPNFIGNRAGIQDVFRRTGATVRGDATGRRVDLTAALNAADAPTDRRITQLAPPITGQVARFALAYPPAAAGNAYVILWGSPPSGVVSVLGIPGLVVHGFLRVDLTHSIPAFGGTFDTSQFVIHSIPIPLEPNLVGYAWDLQSFDLPAAGTDLYLSDNDLTLAVHGDPLPEMVLIRPGVFQMGSAVAGRLLEQPVHDVLISRPFWMARWEVTQFQYRIVTGQNPSRWQGDFRPVELVTWYDAVRFCELLTLIEGAAGRLPSGYVYRLPTEAEWEYCCRAGTTTDWNVGTSIGCQDANFAGCLGSPSTTVVGSYRANAWGLCDMHGNVWEWVLDHWDGTYNYRAGLAVDPVFTVGDSRIRRGGSWSRDRLESRSSNRGWAWPTVGQYDHGFRVVLAPPLTPARAP